MTKASDFRTVIAMDGKIEKGLAGKQGSFKPSVPSNLVRPKPVPVPPKAK
jgi:hypothetical protein